MIRFINNRWQRWVPMLVWMVAIFFVSHQPSTDLPDFGLIDLLLKKAAHFLAYAILGGLGWWGARDSKRPFLTAFLIACLYAISDEYHQTYIPGRNGTPSDVLIDSLGAFVALLLIQKIKSPQHAGHS